MKKPTGLNIWLIDATTYSNPLSLELSASKAEFFRLESCARHRRFGTHPARGSRTFSLGLLQLGNLLIESGHNVHYFSLEDIGKLEVWRSEQPDVIGFSAVTPTVSRCAIVALQLKSKFPQAKIVLGGSHAAAAPRLTEERFPVFDQIITARGRNAAASLAPIRPFARSTPRYELLPFPLREYGINLMTYEGCPFHCYYCHDGTIPHKEALLDGGLSKIASFFPAKTPIHFCDSILGGTPKRALDVCRTLSKYKHGMFLSCDLRAEFIDETLIRALTEAGFVEIRIGLESAYPHVVKKSKRNCLPTDLFRALKLVRRHSNLYVSVYLVTCLPGSSQYSGNLNRKAAKYLLSSKLADQIKHHLYVPYPVDVIGISHSEVNSIADDWSLFDRNSYPTYELPLLPAERIWEDFIMTEIAINEAWRSSLELEPAQINSYALYSDYNVRVYLEDIFSITTDPIIRCAVPI